MTLNKQFSLNWSLYIISTLLWILGITPIAFISLKTDGNVHNSFYTKLLILAFYLLIFTFPAAIMTWETLKQKKLVYSETEVIQPKLFGRTTIRWDEITRAEFKADIRIYSGSKRISITLLAHKEPQKILEFIKNKINSSGKVKV